MITACTAIRQASARLHTAGIEAAEAEARLLFCAGLGIERNALMALSEITLDPGQEAAYTALIDRRSGREPISRILGRREFWSLEFALNAATLDPRPDSETIIEAVLDWRADRTTALRALDLGTGSGCLLCALLSEFTAATGIGTDRAGDAVAMATANAAALGLSGRARFQCADWDDGLGERRFDLIVVNPPYIPRTVIDGLAPEVALFEPRAALDGGPDGLEAYRIVAPIVSRRLDNGGAAFVETGQGQAEPVARIMASAGLRRFVQRADLSGTIRVIGLRNAAVLTNV